MLKTGLWLVGNCHCVDSGILGTVRTKQKQWPEDRYSSELIPSSSSGSSSSTHEYFIQVNSRGGIGEFSSYQTGFSGFVQVNSGGCAAAAASHLQTDFSGGTMKQRIEGKLHNASSNRSSLGSAAWRKPKPEENRVGWGKDYAASSSSVKMQVAVKKELSSSLGDGSKEKAKGPTAAVKVEIEKMNNNSRKINAKISILAPLDVVWGILTDYEHLADFIPGLAESKCLEKRGNKCRLYQVGEQSLALGFTFKAKAVLDCEEKPTKMLDDNIMRRDIDFETVEGDFQVFRGTWRMEQKMRVPSPEDDGLGKEAEKAKEGEGGGGGSKGGGEEAVSTLLSYILVVQPKAWLPVGLVEGRLTSEVKTNLTCIHDRSLVLQLHGS